MAYYASNQALRKILRHAAAVALVLGLGVLALAQKGSTDADKPAAAKTPGIDHTGMPENAPPQGAYEPDVETAAVVDILFYYNSSTTATRLTGLGYTVTSTTDSADLTRTNLQNYDILWIDYTLPPSWYVAQAGDIRTWVNLDAGGLIVVQPGTIGDVTVFPPGFEANVTDASYNNSPAVTFLLPTHGIVNGLTTGDMTGNYDTIPLSSLGASWDVIAVQSSNTANMALAAGDYGTGRLVLSTGNMSSSAGQSGTDQSVIRMLDWAGGGTGGGGGPTPSVPTLSIDDPQGNFEGRSIIFTVTPCSAATNGMSVDYDSVSGTATRGTDFSRARGTLTWGADSAQPKTITVNTTQDSSAEGTEQFQINLSNPSGATIAEGAGTGTILDNDTPIDSDDFEGSVAGWVATGFWHVLTNPQNISVIDDIQSRLVRLPDDGALPSAPTAARLPEASSGTSVWWYGEDATGTFIGSAYSTGQGSLSGGTSPSPSGNTGTLTSPPISLSNESYAHLTFATWWEIEGGDPAAADLMKVNISTDGGYTWAPLGRGLLNPLTPSDGEDFLPFSSGGLARTGVWVDQLFDLTPYVGGTVLIQFEFDTTDDAANGYRGWLIDDFAVLSGPAPAPEITGFTPPIMAPYSARGVAPAGNQTGQWLLVRGSGFASGAELSMNGSPLTLTSDVAVLNSSQVLFKAPTSTSNTNSIAVQNPDLQTASDPNALGIANSQPPRITGITPASSTTSTTTQVLIEGSGLNRNAKVKVGDTTVTVEPSLASATQLIVTVPKGMPAGFHNIRVANPDGQFKVLLGAFEAIAAAGPDKVVVLELCYGWNLVSFPFKPVYDDPACLFGSGLRTVTLAKSFGLDASRRYSVRYSYVDVTKLIPFVGYFVFCPYSSGCQITVSGNNVSTTHIRATRGWNMAGFKQDFNPKNVSDEDDDGVERVLRYSCSQRKYVDVEAQNEWVRRMVGYFIFMSRDRSVPVAP